MSHNTLLVFELTILVLAIFLGFEVISKVPTLLHHLAPEGELTLDWDDEITAGACVAGKQEVAA